MQATTCGIRDLWALGTNSIATFAKGMMARNETSREIQRKMSGGRWEYAQTKVRVSFLSFLGNAK